MISYKDKTWCDAHECSKFEVCDRAYTQKEKKRAIKWWGQPNPPVGFYLNPQILECYTNPNSALRITNSISATARTASTTG